MNKNNSIYLNTIREIALTDLKLRYQGSIAGYFWTLLKPLFLFSVMYFVFTKFLRIGGDIPNYTVYLLLGIVIWSFFTEITSVCMGSIVGKGDLIRKVYFPRIMLIIANSMSSFVVFLANLLIVFVFMVFNKVSIGAQILYFPLLLLELYVFCLGIALLLSSLYVKLRDISHIWEIGLQALFYATPILYPLTLVPPAYAKIMVLSPIAQIIQDARWVLITKETVRPIDVSPGLFWVPYLLVIIVFAVGYFTFSKMASKFAEEI